MMDNQKMLDELGSGFPGQRIQVSGNEDGEAGVELPDFTAGPLNNVEDSSYQKAILRGLQANRNGWADARAAHALRRHKPGKTRAKNPFQPEYYQGTVDPVTVAQRRRKNKIARKQRKLNARKARA